MASILKNSMLLGQIVPSTLKSAVKVQVPYFQFDERLKAYFKKSEELIAEDNSGTCKTGDIVIIHKLEKQLKKEITHQVSETIYKLGDIKDPISGEKVVGDQYRSKLDEIANLYGPTGNFNYETSPERGRLENTRDFTSKPTYRKWHVFEKDDPHAINN